MVLFGGLELLAAGYLVHKHEQSKKELRLLAEEEIENCRRRRAERHHDRRREPPRRPRRADSAPPERERHRHRYHAERYHARDKHPDPPALKASFAPQLTLSPHLLPVHSSQRQTAHPYQQVHAHARPHASSINLSQPSHASVSSDTLSIPPQYTLASRPRPGAVPTPPFAPSSAPTQANLPTSPIWSDGYELSAAEAEHLYRCSSSPRREELYDQPRSALSTGDVARRRARSNSRVRFALEDEEGETRIVEARPEEPPPPYHL